MADVGSTNYDKAMRSVGRPDVASTFATLALADAINRLCDETVAVLKSVRDDIEVIKRNIG